MTLKKEDYYRVLGISPKEAVEGIRKAYREKAKKHHPDRVGDDSTARFQEISEAYEVLSSPEKREKYDHNLEAEKKRNRRHPSDAGPSIEPEPLIPRRGYSVGVHATVEEIFERFRDRRCSAFDSGPEDPEFEIYLKREDALPGSIIELNLPVSVPCRFCGGSGRDRMFPYIACRGSGVEISSVRLFLHLSRFLRDGSLIEMPLRAGRSDPRRIRLLFRIS